MGKAKETPWRQSCCTCNKETLPSQWEVQGSVSNCPCRERHSPMEKPPGQCWDSPGDRQEVALVSVMPDQMKYGEDLWVFCPRCFPYCSSCFCAPDRTGPWKGCPFCTPQDLSNRSLCQGQSCPLAHSLGNQVGLCRSRPWVSNSQTVRQVCTKRLETSQSERLFYCTIAVMAGEESNLLMGSGCPVKSPPIHAQGWSHQTFYFTTNSQGSLHWASSVASWAHPNN